MPQLDKGHPLGDLASELPQAIEAGEMHLYYQPIVSLADRSATILEALPRWNHPRHGMLGPDSFVPVAREAGLLDRLERWAIADAMHQLAHWTSGVPAQISISVNLSTQHALSEALAPTIRDLSTSTGVPASRLGIEILESTLTGMSNEELGSLRALNDVGMNITIDDFSGNLDREMLEQLAVSSVKIGRKIVSRIPDSEADLATIAKVISIGRDLGMAVIATGIENPGQAAALLRAGCHYGQGFLFSVPMPAEVLEERMAAR
jgi:EAL domain-containing protein (putative c-di-GMP-specific phosphodiesterase class I)